jgi:hypothetical protein
VFDFYLRRNLKGEVYRNTLYSAEAFQNEVMKVVALISAGELNVFVMDSFEDVRRFKRRK